VFDLHGDVAEALVVAVPSFRSNAKSEKRIEKALRVGSKKTLPTARISFPF
jgi:hypothetical protein